MSQTKVSDALRNVTAVDGTKINAVDAAKITTGTVNNARITLDAAEIPSLDADKITTGSIDAARIPEAAVTQHVQAVDLSSVKQDIAMLALYNAVSDNRAAYNLPNSFIDQFEDDTGLTTQTDVDRDATGEYVSSVSVGGPAIDAYDKLILHSDGGSSTSFTDSSTSGHTISAFGAVNHSTAKAKFGSTSILFDGTTDYLSLPSHADWVLGTGDFTVDFWYWQVDNGDRVIVGSTSTGSATPTAWRAKSAATLKFGSSHTDNFVGGVTLGQSAWRHCAYTRASNVLRVFVDGTQDGSDTALTTNFSDQRELWIGNAHDGGDLHGYIDEMRISKGIARWTANFTPPTDAYGSTVVNATGTLISDTQTVPSAITKMSGVILLKDGGSSTTTLGTHLTISFSATNGSGSDWVNAASYTAVTAPFSTGVTMIKLGETTVPSGTSPTIRAVWASQTQGGYESQLHGWAMNY